MTETSVAKLKLFALAEVCVYIVQIIKNGEKCSLSMFVTLCCACKITRTAALFGCVRALDYIRRKDQQQKSKEEMIAT